MTTKFPWQLEYGLGWGVNTTTGTALGVAPFVSFLDKESLNFESQQEVKFTSTNIFDSESYHQAMGSSLTINGGGWGQKVGASTSLVRSLASSQNSIHVVMEMSIVSGTMQLNTNQINGLTMSEDALQLFGKHNTNILHLHFVSLNVFFSV